MEKNKSSDVLSFQILFLLCLFSSEWDRTKSKRSRENERGTGLGEQPYLIY